MSAVVVSGLRSSSTETPEISGTTVATSRANPMEFPAIRVHSPSRRRVDTTKQSLRDFIVSRKLKGYVANNESSVWRVVFVIDGKEVHYDIPGENLRKAGIQVRYQPFEMDELRPSSPDLSGKIYRFRPLAKTSDAQIETLPLDAERQRKYDLILGRFGKAKD